VAVLDTGVNYNHPDLKNQIQNLPQGPGIEARTIGTATVNYDGKDISSEGHGSHVAGLIAAQGNNAVGGSGTAPYGVKVLPVNVFFANNGDVVSDSATIIKGIQFAAQQHVSAINMSLGGNGDDPAVKAAIQSAINSGVFVVASAGNTVGAEAAYEIGATNPVFPAIYGGALDGMVTVGSTDSSTGAKSFFSLYSNTLVEIGAPGSQTRTVGLYSTSLGTSYAILQGTSMAAPVVTGAAALAQSFYRYHYKSDLSPSQVEDLLKASATKNAALTAYFKDGNALNMSQLIQTLQDRYPLTKTSVGGGSSGNSCP
jgi:subtilisin family serine protease